MESGKGIVVTSPDEWEPNAEARRAGQARERGLGLISLCSGTNALHTGARRGRTSGSSVFAPLSSSTERLITGLSLGCEPLFPQNPGLEPVFNTTLREMIPGLFLCQLQFPTLLPALSHPAAAPSRRLWVPFPRGHRLRLSPSPWEGSTRTCGMLLPED